MKRVILESPYAGDWLQRWLNVRYARRCVRDALQRGEAPIASHLAMLYFAYPFGEVLV